MQPGLGTMEKVILACASCSGILVFFLLGGVKDRQEALMGKQSRTIMLGMWEQ